MKLCNGHLLTKCQKKIEKVKDGRVDQWKWKLQTDNGSHAGTQNLQTELILLIKFLNILHQCHNPVYKKKQRNELKLLMCKQLNV